MNYIKRLEKENAAMKEMLKELKGYCESPKYFWPNEGVNKKDILNRIEQLQWMNEIDLNNHKDFRSLLH